MSDVEENNEDPVPVEDPAGIELEEGDPSVPSDLLDLHVDLEEAEVSPEDFKETFNDEDSSES